MAFSNLLNEGHTLHPIYGKAQVGDDLRILDVHGQGDKSHQDAGCQDNWRVPLGKAGNLCLYG